MSNTKLYFAYTSLMKPDLMVAVAPGAEFRFTAHYPETKLEFAANGSSEAVPTLTRDPGHTVWGAVFEIPESEVGALIDAENAEGRVEGFDQKAVDREGNKHDCLTFVASSQPSRDLRPNPEYLDAMISGARHWQLPAGWIMGLEDLTEDSLFS
ncbi:MAG: gamma-glutamylcyclotransferase family protein [Acidimicrobiia bacterium]|nr:gamma-glutamylcyclotransferase family protein [Acidimicrobiia bacterium]